MSRFVVLSLFIHGFFTLFFLGGFLPSQSLKSNPPFEVMVEILDQRVQPKAAISSLPPSSLPMAVTKKDLSLDAEQEKEQEQEQLEETLPIESQASETLPYAHSLSDVELLQTYLEGMKKYPRMALKLRHSGVVMIRLFINERGQVSETQILAPSAFETLNQAALQLVSSLKLPSEFKGRGEFVVPISYQLRGASL